jgi:hypothetical protein
MRHNASEFAYAFDSALCTLRFAMHYDRRVRLCHSPAGPDAKT